MKNREKNFMSAVIYIHNAEKRIGSFLEKVIEIMEDNFEHSEVICVNDFSEDKSLAVIREISQNAKTTNVSVLNMSYFHGLELSMNAGIDMAIGDFVYEFDSTNMDFEPNVIMQIYYHALKGYDIVKAVADKKEKISSRLFYKIFDKFADMPYEMSTESFRILSRRVINRIGSMNRTIPYRKAIYSNCGLKTDSIKYSVITKENPGIDKREKHYRTGLAVDSLIFFTQFGYRFSMTMTIIMMLISIFAVVYSIGTYLIAQPVEGWTTTILFLSIAFLGLFGVLTIIVKYLQLLIDMVFKRKHYSFESIEKLTK